MARVDAACCATRDGCGVQVAFLAAAVVVVVVVCRTAVVGCAAAAVAGASGDRKGC